MKHARYSIGRGERRLRAIDHSHLRSRLRDHEFRPGGDGHASGDVSGGDKDWAEDLTKPMNYATSRGTI